MARDRDLSWVNWDAGVTSGFGRIVHIQTGIHHIVVMQKT